MCCCEKPTINGEHGYRWQATDAPSIRPVNAPATEEGDTVLYDEPGRCGGIDSHCHHYRVVNRHGTLYLLVRHGGGDERIRLSNGGILLYGIALLDAARYWTLNAIFQAHHDGARDAMVKERSRWREAAATKRIKTRKLRGSSTVKVWIEREWELDGPKPERNENMKPGMEGTPVFGGKRPHSA